MPGDYSEWEPPESISNSEVKLLSANDSVKLTSCQSRTLPGSSYKKTRRFKLNSSFTLDPSSGFFYAFLKAGQLIVLIGWFKDFDILFLTELRLIRIFALRYVLEYNESAVMIYPHAGLAQLVEQLICNQ